MASITYNLDQDDLRRAVSEYAKTAFPDMEVKGVMFYRSEEDRAPGTFYFSASVLCVRRKDS